MSTLPDGIAARAVALLLLACVLAALWLAALKPLVDLYNANEQRLAEQSRLIDHLRLTASELPGLHSAAAQQAELADGKLLIDAPSDAVAAADLQSRLRDLVAKSGAAIASAEVLEVEPQETFHRIGVRLAMTGSLALLTTVLKGIDEARPVLVVDDLAVRSTLPSSAGSPSGQSVPSTASDDRRLGITMEIHGFRSE
jgi:general secretion pathway protein M